MSEKRWYVHDEHDCFTDYPFDQAQKAMECAADMAGARIEDTPEFDGVHVVCMTAAQHAEYCKRGDMRAAYRIK